MKKILIVDDEYLVRVGIRSFLDWEQHGYTIVGEAADGESAMRKIEQQRPDIVLTDLKMEGMDGFALIAASKKRWPGLQFVVLSSLDDGENVKTAMKLGASDYIFKLTSKPGELLKILDELPCEPSCAPLESMVRKNRSGIKWQLIRNAAQPFCPDRESLQKEFQQLGLSTDFTRPYCVLLLDPGPDDEQGASEQSAPLVKYALENMAEEIIAQHCRGEVYSFTGPLLLAVLQPQDFASGELPARAGQAFAQLYEYAQRYLGIPLLGALSPCACGMEQLAALVDDCRRTLRRPSQIVPGQLCVARGQMRPEIEAVCRSIEKDPAQSLSVKDAAQQSHMSESYFSHLFKKETGVSFVDFVNRQRIRHAARLLESSTLRVGEIALHVGLENPNYFSVLFRKWKGESPQEYRQRFQKAEK